jgi:predicted DNA-binding transcriptional regulator AlpA
MENKSVLIQASPEYLVGLIAEAVEEKFKKLMDGNPQKTEEDILLTKKEVCKIFGCVEETLWHWEKKRILTPIRIGKKVRYKKSQIDEFINSRSNLNC